MKDWLREHHIGQAEVAALLEISVASVSRIVNGKSEISLQRANLLHKRFGMPFDVMLIGEDADDTRGEAGA